MPSLPGLRQGFSATAHQNITHTPQGDQGLGFSIGILSPHFRAFPTARS